MQIVWFKRDLRIFDHRPLVEAARRGKVLCLYIAEPNYWQLSDTSARQWLAIADGLQELDADLQKHYGARLTIRTGDAVTVLEQLHSKTPIAHLWSHEETGNLWTYERDKKVARFCRKNAVDWTEIPQFGVFRALDNRDRWSQLWETFMRGPRMGRPEKLDVIHGETPSLPRLAELGLRDDSCLQRQKGGRVAALKCLDSFLDGRGARYPFEMSSPITAPKACSRLSLHIATGTLSMREIVQACFARRSNLGDMPPEARSIPLKSLDAFIARLHWHCHFIQKLESEPEIEARSVHPLHEAARLEVAHDPAHLKAWITGQTGFPFVDACMRSLVATGWINFRMRAMLMAFASYHLALDWTKSGAALARLFTDYEPGIHWPQVQMQSGQTGINVPRIYNPVKQSFDQDKDGIFIRKWLPELAQLPLAFLHEPWTMREAELEMHKVHLGLTYPTRIVDHEVAAREARNRLTVLRQTEGYRPAGQQVFVKHGSRKRQDRAPARNKPPAKQKPVSRQLMLDL